jgi:transposase
MGKRASSIDAIADKVGLNRCSVMLCLKKFKEGGVENALFDAPGRGRNAEITDEEKAWIINIAFQKPIDFKNNLDDINVSDEISVDILPVKKSS